ncbi:OmpA family protein [Bradyrhizobium sp. NC92]|uniref:OmpA family protein n=1 Tax=Bradyrhizobium sp. (strain NC92) TaxID=55395 RepID=UPI0021A9A746|nr:OmpA family protein [Bradyrhizobium sp. NC92]UWU67300.1 OmpA family protein [Bradyrhizobium sp. NC92]
MLRFRSILLVLPTLLMFAAPCSAQSEKAVLDALLAKKLMRCPVGHHCNDPGVDPKPDVTVPFGEGSARLDRAARAGIALFVDRYRTKPGHRVVLTGYADALGTPADNERLSLRRALAVRRFLVTRYGLSAGGISTHASGVRYAGRVSAEDRIVTMSLEH